MSKSFLPHLLILSLITGPTLTAKGQEVGGGPPEENAGVPPLTQDQAALLGFISAQPGAWWKYLCTSNSDETVPGMDGQSSLTARVESVVRRQDETIIKIAWTGKAVIPPTFLPNHLSLRSDGLYDNDVLLIKLAYFESATWACPDMKIKAGATLECSQSYESPPEPAAVSGFPKALRSGEVKAIVALKAEGASITPSGREMKLTMLRLFAKGFGLTNMVSTMTGDTVSIVTSCDLIGWGVHRKVQSHKKQGK